MLSLQNVYIKQNNENRANTYLFEIFHFLLGNAIWEICVFPKPKTCGILLFVSTNGTLFIAANIVVSQIMTEKGRGRLVC
jgi:hypothetical protein